MKVYKAINAVQADLASRGISKDETNTFDRYKFRGIDAVYNALSPLLAKHGLCILPRMLSREIVERQSNKGTALFYVTVEAEFDFVAVEDGSKHIVKTFGEAMDRGDKATNKAMSAAYKYACFQAFAIPTEGDNDADTSSHEVKAKRHKPMPDNNGEALSAERQGAVQDAADAAISCFGAGDEVGAYEEASAITDTQERLYLWELLAKHSELRAAIKKLARADREDN